MTCPLLPAGQMARQIRIPVGWLKSEADAGRIPHVRAGRAYLFDPDTVVGVLVERAKGEPTVADTTAGATQADQMEAPK